MRPALALVALLGLLVAGCGDKSPGSAGSGTKPETTRVEVCT